ncbi:MAG: hypothetical protein AAGF77_04575, partial [Bacteroidota bacterium]
MKVNRKFIKLVLLLLVITAMYGFSEHRSRLKKWEGIQVQFQGENTLFITEDAVNKLLIQNYGSVKNRDKEPVVLKTIETIIESDPMVKKAQVYCSVDGTLISKIVQKNPIGRVEGRYRCYLDDEGKRMPFSKYHSARVPLVTGNITEDALKGAYKILRHTLTD